jgi:hypothetical protein
MTKHSGIGDDALIAEELNFLQGHLKCLGACVKALAWAGDYDDPMVAWRACERGDWLLWLALKLPVERKALVRAACACARLALPFTQDERPSRALRTAERWAAGDRSVTLRDVNEAAEECKEAALDAGCYAAFDAANAAYAALYAAKAATTEGSTKEAAAAAAEAVGEAARDAALTPLLGDAARAEVLRKCACIVRRWIDEATICRLWQNHVQRKRRRTK